MKELILVPLNPKEAFPIRCIGETESPLHLCAVPRNILFSRVNCLRLLAKNLSKITSKLYTLPRLDVING